MTLILKPLVRNIILANYRVSAGLCRLNQAFAGLRQAATERKYGWPRDSIRHNLEGGIYTRVTRPIPSDFSEFWQKKERSRRRQAWTEGRKNHRQAMPGILHAHKKLQMKREALEKLNRRANEIAPVAADVLLAAPMCTVALQ